MIGLPKRLRASLRCDAINGDSFERSVCAKQMREAADSLERADARIAELERECAQWRETENKRIAELGAEVAALRVDAERYRWLRQKIEHGPLTISRATDWSLEPWGGDNTDKEIDAARAGSGGESK